MQSITFHNEWIIRILIATLCGSIIGYERRNRNKEAGIRTHAIISLGSALIMVVSKYGFSDVQGYDAARMAAQIVSGVGFLGAGVIFVKHGTVSGLTTAAGMWATSGVGSCVGAGLYDIGILTTIAIVGLQFLFHMNIFHRFTTQGQIFQIQIEKNDNALIDALYTMKKYGIIIQSMKVEKLNTKLMTIEIDGVTLTTYKKEELLKAMMKKEYVKKLSYV